MPARWTPRCALLLVAVLATACGSAPDKALKAAVSWGATAERVGEAWLAGNVPIAYARRTARSAREALSQQRDVLRSASPATGTHPGALADHLAALERAVGHLEAALDAGDRRAVKGATAEVAGVTRAITPWARGA